MNEREKIVDAIKLFLDQKEAAITESWKKEALKIEKQFFPNKEIDLAKSLFDAIRCVAMIDFINRSHPTNKKIRNELKELEKVVRKLVDVLAVISDETKAYADKSIGHVIKIMDDDEYRDSKWTFQTFERDSRLTLLNTIFLLRKIPQKRGGPNKKSKRIEMIHWLVSIFRKGRDGKIDYPKKNSRKKSWKGDVFDFVVAVEPLLGRLGISFGTEGSLGTDYSIGKTITDVMKEHDTFFKK